MIGWLSWQSTSVMQNICHKSGSGLTMPEVDLVVGRAKKAESKRKYFPFRELVLPPNS
jgi:hypothetical protein